MRDENVDEIPRRNVLEMCAAGAGTATIGFAVSGTARKANGNGNGHGGGKSGGRGQTSSPVDLDRPFVVAFDEVITTNASCQSDNSADQEYNRYHYRYCDESEEGEWTGTICVIPDDSDVNETRVYEFRSAQDCNAPSSRFQTRFSFGPSNSEHDC